MSNLTLGCCITKKYLGGNRQSLSNLTEFINLVKPCFAPNESISTILYLASQHTETTNCPKETIKYPYCDVNNNKSEPMLAAFWILVMLIAVGGNFLVCLVIYKTRSLRMALTNHFISSLAISDIMVGMFLVPVKIISTFRSGNFCVSSAVCDYYVTLDNISFVASITNLLVITTDRIIAIDRPYGYTDIVTKKRSRVAIIVVWLYAIIMGALTNVKWSETDKAASSSGDMCWTRNKYYVTYVFTAIFYLPAIFMGVAQGRMLHIALKHSRDMATTSRIAENSSKEGSDEESMTMTNSRQLALRVRRVLREYRAVKVVMVVYGTFVACWLPVSIMALIHAWYPTRIEFKNWHITIFAEVLPVLNSTFNFFIYSVMNRQYRKAFRRLGKKIYLWCTNEFA